MLCTTVREENDIIFCLVHSFIYILSCFCLHICVCVSVCFCVSLPAGAVGVVLLESHQVAPRGGLLRLLGSGVACGGGAEQQVSLFESVCCDSGVDPRQVAYVEAHHDFRLRLSAHEPASEEERGRREAGRDQELRAIDQVYGWRSSSSSSLHLAAPQSSPGPAQLEGQGSVSGPSPLLGDMDATATIQLRQVSNTAH